MFVTIMSQPHYNNNKLGSYLPWAAAITHVGSRWLMKYLLRDKFTSSALPLSLSLRRLGSILGARVLVKSSPQTSLGMVLKRARPAVVLWMMAVEWVRYDEKDATDAE